MDNYLLFNTPEELKRHFSKEYSSFLFDSKESAYIDKELLNESFPLIVRLFYKDADCASVGLGYEYRKANIQEMIEEVNRAKQLAKMLEAIGQDC